jgi:hypothetical protein
MRVLLADVPWREQAFDASYPNLGVLYLIGSARKRFAGQARQVLAVILRQDWTK